MSELRFPLAEAPDEFSRERGRLMFAGPVDFVKGVVAMSGLPPADLRAVLMFRANRQASR